jgi:hypothetical protein
MVKKGMNKGPKITLIVVGVIVLLVAGLFTFFWFIEQTYTDPEGWTAVPWEEDTYETYFPDKLNTNSEDILFMGIGTNPKDSKIYIDTRENVHIDLGENQDYQILVLEGRRALYKSENKDPSLKVWIEKVGPEDYPKYGEYISNEINPLKQNANFSVVESSYSNSEYYIYMRTNLDIEKRYNSIGGAYILLPNEDTIIYLFLFNTLYQKCFPNSGPDCRIYEEEYVLTENEVESIVHQFVDNINNN